MIDPDVLWSCTTCGACVEQCPVDIEHVDHIVDMRRYQVMIESEFPSELGVLFRNLENKGNPWGQNARNRLDWTKSLDFEVPVFDGELAPRDGVPVLGRLRGRVRRQGQEDRAGHGGAAAPRRRGLRRARQRGDLHRRPGAPVGQRVPLPDAGGAEHRDAQRRSRARAGDAQDRHDLPALLQHARAGVPAARRALRGRPPHAAAQQPGPRGQAGPGAAPDGGRTSPITTPATWAGTTRSTPRRASCRRRPARG